MVDLSPLGSRPVRMLMLAAGAAGFGLYTPAFYIVSSKLSLDGEDSRDVLPFNNGSVRARSRFHGSRGASLEVNSTRVSRSSNTPRINPLRWNPPRAMSTNFIIMSVVIRNVLSRSRPFILRALLSAFRRAASSKISSQHTRLGGSASRSPRRYFIKGDC